jgi:hypothetical protein
MLLLGFDLLSFQNMLKNILELVPIETVSDQINAERDGH